MEAFFWENVSVKSYKIYLSAIWVWRFKVIEIIKIPNRKNPKNKIELFSDPLADFVQKILFLCFFVISMVELSAFFRVLRYMLSHKTNFVISNFESQSQGISKLICSFSKKDLHNHNIFCTLSLIYTASLREAKSS